MTAPTPGQAAYEASLTVIGEDLDGEPWAWGSLTPKLRQSWQAAAQAAIDAFLAGDSVSAESIREALAAQEQPAPAPASQVRRHAEQTAAAHEQPAPELAAAMAETRQVRSVLNEVLMSFEDSRSNGWYARVSGTVLNRWCKRAGVTR